MTRYAVGDLQGCLTPLQCLLEKVNFNSAEDELWLVGDLINRGPQSLETLRFVKQLGDCTRIVLGNHDLHFLAIAFDTTHARKSDTFDELLAAHDRDELVQWLLQQPLMYSDPSDDFHMVHAGIPPIWDIDQAKHHAREVEQVLAGNKVWEYFKNMYGNSPDCWSDNLEGWARLRVITNYFTRMRYCTASGRLDFDNKLAEYGGNDSGFLPWFQFENRPHRQQNIVFGHWASLQGQTNTPNVYAIDTGCVWGNKLSMLNLDTETLVSCNCDT